VDPIAFLLQFPAWALIAGGVVVLAIFWVIASAFAAFFIFTGPPDTFDVDIKDSGKGKK
jgi:hypothetical protein